MVRGKGAVMAANESCGLIKDRKKKNDTTPKNGNMLDGKGRTRESKQGRMDDNCCK